MKSYLQELGIRTPPREHRNGKTSGDKHFTTGHLYQILSKLKGMFTLWQGTLLGAMLTQGGEAPACKQSEFKEYIYL